MGVVFRGRGVILSVWCGELEGLLSGFEGGGWLVGAHWSMSSGHGAGGAGVEGAVPVALRVLTRSGLLVPHSALHNTSISADISVLMNVVSR